MVWEVDTEMQVQMPILRKLAQISSVYMKKSLVTEAPPGPHSNCCLSSY